jgi:hypothetical protein
MHKLSAPWEGPFVSAKSAPCAKHTASRTKLA